ncbi:hypothetical protein THAOC_36914 [Thalassiosira oceanica]|uniref:Cytochrome P450 n=1 Tax=Thalassiosira oceanica TaxID=159749 RepID=K0RDB3_THAOC|nr:hypothetical protein THAOC_36914 [Thalassiosira oceanica]|eukprot:EJK44537.1 hypothetical protein THAOC_36914 [Thalassiosira oceanica]
MSVFSESVLDDDTSVFGSFVEELAPGLVLLLIADAVWGIPKMGFFGTIAILCIGLVYYFFGRLNDWYSKKIFGGILPPFAPGSMMKHMEMATCGQYPWWLLEIANKSNSRVFRVSRPTKGHKCIVGEYQVAREILTDPQSKKPPAIYNQMRYVNGSGDASMFTLNGKRWHAKRRACVPAFSSSRVRKMNSIALEHTEAFLELLRNGDGVFDVSSDMQSLVLGAISESAFDYIMSPQEKKEFSESVRLSLIEYARNATVHTYRSWLGWLLPGRRRASVVAQRIRNIMIRVLKRYRESGETEGNRGTLIQLIASDDNAFRNDDEKLAQLVEFLVAGHDTTSYSISWALISLAKHPEIQTRLRDELSRMRPENWSQSEYLRMCMKESTRLNPVSSSTSVRVIGRDIRTKGGYVIPKGSTCFLWFLLLSRDPSVFDDPDEYKPSRWENPTREMLDSFMPFSLGARNCIGQTLAGAHLHTVVARICSEFELTVEDEGKVDFFMTLKPIGARLKVRRVSR